MNRSKAAGDTIGVRIRQCRERIGLSQERLGEIVGLSRSSIAEVEGGRRKVDVSLLRYLARALGTSPLHLLGEDDEDGEADEASALEPRILREVATSSVEDEQAFRLFLRTLRAYRQLAGASGRKRAVLPETTRVFSARSPKYQIAAEAIRVREMLGLGDSPCSVGLRERIEALGVPVFLMALDPSEVSGLYVNYPGIGPVLLVNSRQVKWRQGFTLAHEFGHVWLHRKERAIASRIFGAPSQEREIEVQANSFAAEFLMPEKAIGWVLSQMEVGEQLSVEQVVHLQRFLGVSYRAMLVRLKALRLIGKERFEELGAQSPVSWASRLGYSVDPSETGKAADVPLMQQYPAELVSLVLEAWNAGQLGEGRAAEILQMDIITLNRFIAEQNAAAAWQQREAVPDDVGG